MTTEATVNVPVEGQRVKDEVLYKERKTRWDQLLEAAKLLSLLPQSFNGPDDKQ